MTGFFEFLNKVNAFVWGLPLLILLLGTGIYLSIRLKFISFTKFGFIMKNTLFKMFDKHDVEEGQVTPFQALSTALAATVGTGNIVGVSGAILIGGPGAVFWMWFAALFGMLTKYSEATLAIAYRETKPNGEVAGGPMYYLKNGVNMEWLGKIFAFLGMFATLGIGNSVQSNAISNVLYENFSIPKLATGIVVAVIAFLVIIGGIKRIGAFTEKLVPFMAAFYLIGAIIILIMRAQYIGPAFAQIFKYAFTARAAAGGGIGYTVMMAMRSGVARGVFTNEAGLGSSPIAHAAATTDHPVRQGMWGVFEVFVDTIVVCTMTALVILTTTAWEAEPNAATLVADSFEQGFSGGKYIVTLGLVLFALSTILSWEYYGETCARFVFGDKIGPIYKIIFIPIIVLGATINLDNVWIIAEIMNGLMAIPNLIGLLMLSGVVVKLTNDFFKDPDRIRTSDDEWRHLT